MFILFIGSKSSELNEGLAYIVVGYSSCLGLNFFLPLSIHDAQDLQPFLKRFLKIKLKPGFASDEIWSVFRKTSVGIFLK